MNNRDKDKYIIEYANKGSSRRRKKRQRFIMRILSFVLIISAIFLAVKFINQPNHDENKSTENISKNEKIDENNQKTNDAKKINNDKKTDNAKDIANAKGKANAKDAANASELNLKRYLGVDPNNGQPVKFYVYGEKLKENDPVGNEYFDDACFIGNSQMEGVSVYNIMQNATVYAGKGIMVNTIFTRPVIKSQGKRITIMDAVKTNEFGKIYIMLGANELGWASDQAFIDQYAKVIDELRKLQPKALIYVCSIMPVTKERSDNDPIYNNKNINRFNELILKMTEEKEVFYLDSKEAVANEDGNLPNDVAADGVHLSSKYYEKWFDYMKTHTVVE